MSNYIKDIDLDFVKNNTNHSFCFYRIYIYLCLNNLFNLEKFRNTITILNTKYNLNAFIVDKVPITFNGNEIYFMYKEPENTLVFMANHKYYYGTTISLVLKLVSDTYDNLENEDCSVVLNSYNCNPIINFIHQINKIPLPHLILNKITDVINLDFIFNNYVINNDIKIKKFDYNPKQFNTIDFITYLQEIYKTTIYVVIDVQQYITTEITYGNHIMHLEIKPYENVRQKIKSLNKDNYKRKCLDTFDIFNRLKLELDKLLLDKRPIFVNSLKNMYLPSFVNNIAPLDFLKCDKICKVFGIMPTDKDGNTYVYYNV